MRSISAAPPPPPPPDVGGGNPPAFCPFWLAHNFNHEIVGMETMEVSCVAGAGGVTRNHDFSKQINNREVARGDRTCGQKSVNILTCTFDSRVWVCGKLTLFCGVPQGSALGTVLIALYLLPLGWKMLNNNIKGVSHLCFIDYVQLPISF